MSPAKSEEFLSYIAPEIMKSSEKSEAIGSKKAVEHVVAANSTKALRLLGFFLSLGCSLFS